MCKNRRWLSAILCAVLICMLLPTSFGAAGGTQIAVNDELRKSTAIRQNGEYYIPYEVLDAVNVRAASSDDILMLFDANITLTFELSENYVHDQLGNVYETPAYVADNGVYVPLKLVCAEFGLGYSVIPTSSTVVRIVNGSEELTDSAFVNKFFGNGMAGQTDQQDKPTPTPDNNNNNNDANQNTPTDEPAVNNTPQTNTTTPTTPEEPAVPVKPPTPEEQIPEPSVVYLAFTGALTDQTATLLDQLKNANRKAIFFLPADNPTARDELVRRLQVEGQGFGLVVTMDSLSDADAVVKTLAQANDRLILLTGSTTRLLCIDGGSDKLTIAQRSILHNAGYRLWDATVDGQEDTKTAYDAARAVLTTFQGSDTPAMARFRQNETTLEELTYVLNYLAQTGIKTGVPQLYTTPLNIVNDER